MMSQQKSFFLNHPWLSSALIILTGGIISYLLYGPNSIVTSFGAIIIGFFFPLLANFFGITRTARLQQQDRVTHDEPMLELPSDLEDDDTNNDWERHAPEGTPLFHGMERYILTWAIITAIFMLLLPILLKSPPSATID